MCLFEYEIVLQSVSRDIVRVIEFPFHDTQQVQGTLTQLNASVKSKDVGFQKRNLLFRHSDAKKGIRPNAAKACIFEANTKASDECCQAATTGRKYV